MEKGCSGKSLDELINQTKSKVNRSKKDSIFNNKNRKSNKYI